MHPEGTNQTQSVRKIIKPPAPLFSFSPTPRARRGAFSRVCASAPPFLHIHKAQGIWRANLHHRDDSRHAHDLSFRWCKFTHVHLRSRAQMSAIYRVSLWRLEYDCKRDAPAVSMWTVSALSSSEIARMPGGQFGSGASLRDLPARSKLGPTKK